MDNNFKILTHKRCIIGEGPVWNEFDKKLYFVNAMGGNEYCTYDMKSGTVTAHKLDVGVAAIAFSKTGEMLVSRKDGAFLLERNGTVKPIYDINTHKLQFCNDAKVGPDGRFYVGTQSGKRYGVSDKINGKLYSIDKDGNVKVLLDGLILSNGMEWSFDEKRFYHTDSDTSIIKEYDFDKARGEISFTGRQMNVPGVDGFTIDKNDNLIVSCWGKEHIAVVDTKSMKITDYIDTPCKIPTSCAFCGENMDVLAVTTASYGADIKTDKNAGFTLLKKMNICGRKPYLFG